MTSSLMIVTATVTSMNVTIFTDQRNNNHRFDVGDLDNQNVRCNTCGAVLLHTCSTASCFPLQSKKMNTSFCVIRDLDNHATLWGSSSHLLNCLLLSISKCPSFDQMKDFLVLEEKHIKIEHTEFAFCRHCQYMLILLEGKNNETNNELDPVG